MNHMIILLAVFTFGLNAARVASEWQEESALDRLSTAIDSDKKVEALKILNDEHDSLRSTQEGANLAIKACAIYGDVKLFNSYIQPKLRTSIYCVPYVDPNSCIPDSKGIEDALIEIIKTRAYHCIDDYHFLQYDTKILCSIITKLGAKIIKEKAVAPENSSAQLSDESLKIFDSLNYLAVCMTRKRVDKDAITIAENLNLFENPRHWCVCIA